MPLLITEKDIKWCETQEKIKINVSIRSQVDTKLSLLLTSQYLKVNSPPWFWECFLYSTVNVPCCTARVGDCHVSFELKKELPVLWGMLESENKKDKSFQRDQREKAFEEHTKRLSKDLEENNAKKQEIYKESVRKQILVDDKERKLIEKEKRAESKKVEAQMEEQFQMQQRLRRKKLQDGEKSCNIPPARKTGTIAVKFTPRVFPTALRESQEAEEREWLEKQAAAAVSLELDLKDLKPQERNPEWLKRKAQFLFDKQDYQGAVNAYSLAIRMCPSMYSLYLERSECHLHLRNLHKCLEDSSRAIELLHPPVASNAENRLKAHKIRGSAFRHLNLPLEGLVEFKAALKINTQDEESIANAEELRKLIQDVDFEE